MQGKIETPVVEENEDMMADVGKCRISWIDTTKTLCLVCVVVAHSTSSQMLHDIIYSFHIPLFIVLSGYTLKASQNWKDIYVVVKKAFLTLYLPIIITYVIETCLLLWRAGNSSPADFFLLLLSKIVFCNGIVWFFCALFWARILYSIMVLLKLEKAPFVCMIAGACFLFKLFFPSFTCQNIDVVPLFIVILYCGRLFRKYDGCILDEKPLVCLCAFVIWAFFVNRFVLDIGLRWFSGGLYCVIVPLCAMYFVLTFCVQVSKAPVVSFVSSLIGRKTVLIICIHHLDQYFLELLSIPDSPGNFLFTISRLLLVFAAFGMIAGALLLSRIIRPVPRQQ